MAVKTKRFTAKRTAGFGSSLQPDQIIKNLKANVVQLSPENIAETVDDYRQMWDDDYGKRDFGPITREEIFRLFRKGFQK